MSLGIVKTWNEMFPDYPMAAAQWGVLPPYMRQPLYEYVMYGSPCGSFLSSIICDEPISAVWAKADHTNRAQMNGWIMFLYNDFPSQARGSREAMHKWIDKGGIKGKETTQ